MVIFGFLDSCIWLLVAVVLDGFGDEKGLYQSILLLPLNAPHFSFSI